ncbi:hypothetical protein QJQ45_026382, partial [Haematococcus lacustris]
RPYFNVHPARVRRDGAAMRSAALATAAREDAEDAAAEAAKATAQASKEAVAARAAAKAAAKAARKAENIYNWDLSSTSSESGDNEAPCVQLPLASTLVAIRAEPPDAPGSRSAPCSAPRPTPQPPATDPADPADSASSWQLSSSIFAERMAAPQAQAAREKQLDLDWKRVLSRGALRQHLAVHDSAVTACACTVDQLLARIATQLHQQGELLVAVWTYFASLGVWQGVAALSLSLGAWRCLVAEARCGPRCPAGSLRPADCDALFLSVLLGTDTQLAVPVSQEPTGQLMRFEFYELLVRLALARHVLTHTVPDTAEALQVLTQELQANLAPAACHLPHSFRMEQLYTSSTEHALKAALPLLRRPSDDLSSHNGNTRRSLFSLFCTKSSTRCLILEDWLEILATFNFLGVHTGVDLHAAALLFHQSQAVLVDEVQQRSRAAGLNLEDWLEAVARLADLINPPAAEALPEQVAAALGQEADSGQAVQGPHPYFTLYSSLQQQQRGLPLPGAPEPIPCCSLAGKVAGVLAYLRHTLCLVWGARDEEQLLARMAGTTRSLLSAV